MELESILEKLSGKNVTAEVKGDGISQFVYAKCGSRVVELSQEENGIWVEFWSGDSEEAERGVTFNSYNEALVKILAWLLV